MNRAELQRLAMDQIALVERQIEDGQKLVEQLAVSGLPVCTAFWVNATEASQWYLYIVSPVVDERGLTEAYRRVQAIMSQMPEPFWLDPFEVKVIGTKNPIAEEVVATLERHPGKRPIRYAARDSGR